VNGIKACIDTNVFLNVLNREIIYYSHSREVLQAIERGSLEAFVPTLVIAEMLTGFYIEERNKDAQQFLSALISDEHMKIVPLSVDIAASSARVRAETGLKLPDAMILATAIKTQSDFVVSNDDCFPATYEGVKTVKSEEMMVLLKKAKKP
jgi:predicted nucleic acid-binding protein